MISPAAIKAHLRVRVRRELRRRRQHQNGRNALLRSRGRSAVDAYVRDIRRYWADNYGKRIDVGGHLNFTAITGVEDVRFIPDHIWRDEIVPMLNPLHLRPAFRDKNLGDVLLTLDGRAPSTVMRRVRGHYFTGNGREVSRDEAWQRIRDATADGDLIAKPSNSDNGQGITLLTTDRDDDAHEGLVQTLARLESRLGSDYIVQTRIVQHDRLSEMHPASVNTLRMVTLRWERKIQHLGTFVRFGTEERINDNAGSGGIVVGVDQEGRLNSMGIAGLGSRLYRHPVSGLAFKDLVIPGWNAFPRFVEELHKQILHFDLISWDIAVAPDASPMFLEMNFKGSGYRYQWALGHGILAEFSAPMLNRVRGQRHSAGHVPT